MVPPDWIEQSTPRRLPPFELLSTPVPGRTGPKVTSWLKEPGLAPRVYGIDWLSQHRARLRYARSAFCGRSSHPAANLGLIDADQGPALVTRASSAFQVKLEQLVRTGLRNRLLGSLPEHDLALLQPLLVPITLPFRKRLQSANRSVGAAYFIDSGLASVVIIANGSRSQAEVAVVGYEGMVGLPIVLGVGRSPCEIFIQVEGHGHCITAEDLTDAMSQSQPIREALLCYVHVFAVQGNYTALANAHGKLEERLARWLLMAHDRVAADELLLTHEFLALMLGVRRAGVTVALQHFEGKGLIDARRGSIVIKDRDGLEEDANGLYGTPEAEFDRLFPRAKNEAFDVPRRLRGPRTKTKSQG